MEFIKKSLRNSPINFIKYKDLNFYLKRDDLLDKDLSGNKARKLYSIYIQDLSSYKTLISFGGNQSNLMYSLSVFCKQRGLKYIYFAKKLSKYLENNLNGNLKESLNNNMNLIQIEHKEWESFIEKLNKTKLKKNVIFIHQGGLQKEAELGVKILADEINTFFKSKNIEKGKIFLPSGTGATSLYLQKHIISHQVYTTACVGSSEYLEKQFAKLEKDSLNYPIILETSKKYHFGKLYQEFLDLHIDIKNKTGIEFDMLYDSKGLIAVLEHKEIFKNGDFIYIHCGGILGNNSMIDRYNVYKKNNKIKILLT